ncbi:polypeptide N-acetylgalactosaminyltransferase 10 [Xenopus tropicalis]|nr:polypeptide N-acetylgalactosaminyltransferase 10 [Xenopus tropicalis]|eukprot:XP_002945237.1 PREDICTED: polypeptide N-acetylgalactosaminyltransferase 10-like [Xenopus tropicalis]
MDMCVGIKHVTSGTEIRLEACNKGRNSDTWGARQVFTLGWREDIRPGIPQHTMKSCFDAVSQTSPVTLFDCHGMKGNQLWKYRRDKTVYHPTSNSCMDCNEGEYKIFMNKCNPSSPTQQWTFEHINSTILEAFNRNKDL